jgi:uncharacterized protein (DUF885 family)
VHSRSLRPTPLAALATVAALACAAACSMTSPKGPALDRGLDARRKALASLLAEQWEDQLRDDPEFASILGDPRYNDRWTDASPAAIARNLDKDRAFLRRFEALDVTGFPEQEALTHQLVMRELREGLEGARFEDWLMPIEQVSGIHLRLPQLVPLLPFATVKDYEDYIKRLEALPTVLDQAIASMSLGLGKNLVPPRLLLDRALPQVDALAGGKPGDSPFAQPGKSFPAAIAKADQTRLRAALDRAVATRVLPAYAKLAAYLRQDYIPKGRQEIGTWALPDGVARYAFDVKRSTTTTLTPDQWHETGLREVARIEAEQTAIAKRLGFATLAALQDHVRKDKKLYAKSRAEILQRYQLYTDQMYAAIPRLFGRLPRQKMIILAVEEFREKDAPGAEYQQGTPDGSRPGMVRINTASPTKRLTIDMETTAFHEGVPGHHLQIAIQQELGDLPPIRQQASYGAFQEGWALYAERLGREVGLYTDPYNEYGQLQGEMLRAIRLVVDTGIHARKWSRDQVVKFFHDHSSIDEPTVQNETDRYIAWPAQALSYKAGQLTILRLREKAQTQLGASFDLRGFHDTVLGAGALPLDVLEIRIDDWIKREKARS